MLKRVRSHYQTGEPLSDDLIVRLRAVKDFCTGDFVQRQLSLAQLSTIPSNPVIDGTPLPLNFHTQRLSTFVARLSFLSRYFLSNFPIDLLVTFLYFSSL